MPMFYTPKPRQFTYRPRFYDPEKERWEALKQKYADERAAQAASALPEGTEKDVDLAYFERRVREIDRTERQKRQGLTWKDLFRKREMPTFNYTPRFSDGATSGDGTADLPVAAVPTSTRQKRLKIKRRYDISDTDYMKPVPASKIMLYTLLVCMLLYWILF